MMLIMGKRQYRNKRSGFRFKTDKVFLALMVIFIVGTLLGAVSYLFISSENTEYIRKIAEGYIRQRKEQSQREVFISIFVPNVLIAAAAFLFRRVSALFPLIWLFPFFQGLGFGCFSVSLLSFLKKNSVMAFAFTAFQERFFIILALNMIFTYMIKANKFSQNRNSDINIGAAAILSLLLIGISSALSTIIFFKFGLSLV